MARFGTRSKSRLHTCDDRLKKLFKKVVEEFDCTVIEGFRNKNKQNIAFKKGASKLKFPHGKHNQLPSIAVDIAPYPIDWKDRDRFHYFGGYVLGIAKTMGLNIRWGGDWNQDTQTKDNNFDDLVHFEIKENSDGK
jgi:peptidoglycan L-alanyl-D-glutamate endopeptidase CwlK|tara:strand:+ start:335 stop:742 length:408 start_codon:yes stop_codon:yes gene_type:complete